MVVISCGHASNQTLRLRAYPLSGHPRAHGPMRVRSRYPAALSTDLLRKDTAHARCGRHRRRGQGVQDAVRQDAVRPARRRGSRVHATFREQIAATWWQPSRPSPGDRLDRLRRLFAGRLVERLDGVEIDGCRSVAPRRRARGGRRPGGAVRAPAAVQGARRRRHPRRARGRGGLTLRYEHGETAQWRRSAVSRPNAST